LRTRNFGLRTLVEPVTVDGCAAEIRGYDAQDAAHVAEQARRDADLERSLDRFEQLYAEILDGPRRPSFAPEQHAFAVARFLHENLPRRPVDPRWPFMAERQQLQDRIASIEVEVRQERIARGEAIELVAELRRQLATASQVHGQMQREMSQARAALSESSAALAGLKNSRMLRLGRFLRRLARRPVPY